MLIDVQRATLLVVDIQEKLVTAVADPQRHVSVVSSLISAAVEVGLPVVFTEQYPKGLGGTLPVLRACAPDASVVEKIHFSCVAGECLPEEVLARDQVVLCGMEAHVCVLQTALELKALGKEVFIVADGVASRSPEDLALALRRYEQVGVYLVSREMVLFESLRVSGTDLFRRVSQKWLVDNTQQYLSRDGLSGISRAALIGKTFAEVLSLLEKEIDTLPNVLEMVSDGAQHMVTLCNRAGQSGSWRVYKYLLKHYGCIDAEAARAGLKLYAEHTLDAVSYHGKHPNIDRLFDVIAGRLPTLYREYREIKNDL